jgi:hypothetical protein
MVAGITIAVPAIGQDGGDTSAATGISRLLNPAISLNGLLAATTEGTEVESDEHEHGAEGEHAHGHGALDKGFNIQEVELRLTSTVDPYTHADVILAFPDLESVEIEEAILTTRELPGGLGARLGKFYEEFGRHNRLHTHQFPFIDAPLPNALLLGDHGLNEVGAELAYLTPFSWYSEVIGAVFQGDNQLLVSGDDEDFAYLLRCRNFWDLDQNTTLDLGVSGVAGSREIETAYLGGLDLTLVWSPAVGLESRKLVWQSEWIGVSERNGVEHDHQGGEGLEDGDRLKPWGAYSFLQLKASRRFWVQGRYDHLEPPRGVETEALRLSNRWSALVAFIPSEFSALRLQYNYLRSGGETDHQFTAQINFTIGSHPAHRY